MERKIGEVFEYNGERYVVEYGHETCEGCAFFTTDYDRCKCNLNIAGHCINYERKDKKGVIFVKLKTENMEERTIKLSLEKAKEFYKKGGEFKDLALSAFSEKELKEALPKTWEEFCNQNDKKEGECFISSGCFATNVECSERQEYYDRNILPNKHAAEQHLALMQLHQLRDCYRQGWFPKCGIDNTFIQRYIDGDLTILTDKAFSHFLSFQNEEIANEFLHNFRDLIDTAGDLIG